MLTPRGTLRERVAAHAHDRVLSWQTGSSGSQAYVLALLLGAVTVSFVASRSVPALVPLTAYFFWLLLGMLLLRFVPLVWLSATVWLAGMVNVLDRGIGWAAAAQVLSLSLSIALVVYQASRQRSGLPVTLSEALLVQLRDRLQAQGTVPALPPGWRCHSAMLSAHGTRYAGDFLVADLRDQRLEMVLVDVCGKGVAVGPQALQFAGALGGLIGALPPYDLMMAANAFLLRQPGDESFSTAVHLLVDLDSGDYTITSAGHPPALHWDPRSRRWDVDNARGTALGIVPEPELHASTGRLGPGEALMFYTDGVIESRGHDLDEGIEWLRGVGAQAASSGFTGAPRRILRQIPRGDDDRAVLIVERAAAGPAID